MAILPAKKRRCWQANFTWPVTLTLLPTTSVPKALLAKFNAAATDAEEQRRLLLVELLGRIGEGTVLKPTLRCDYGHNIAIGDRTFVNYDCVLLDCNRITIGNEVQIAPGSTSTRRPIRLKVNYDARALSTPCPSRSKTAFGLGAGPPFVQA